MLKIDQCDVRDDMTMVMEKPAAKATCEIKPEPPKQPKRTSGLNWSCTDDELLTILAIVQRAIEVGELFDVTCDRRKLVCDIMATHCNGCRLRLDDMLSSDEEDFIHDIQGIHDNIDRSTGKLDNLFQPRCAE